MLLDNLKKLFDLAIRNDDRITRFAAYLIKYGYLKDSDLLKDVSIEQIIEAIKLLQSLAGLVPHGVVNAKTLGLIDLPRCSCKDFLTEDASQLNKWAFNKLRYCITGYDTELSKADWSSTIAEAFYRHSAVCNLTFEEVANPADANLLLGVGSGANDEFDGPSGTLAWFELPGANHRSQLHGKFDLAETWVAYNKGGRGIKLVNVACHEIGHGLGLSHSKISGALMAPFYNPDIGTPQQNDDIIRLVDRYGKPTITPNPTPTPTPVPTPTDETIIRIKGSFSIDGYRVTKLG